MCCALCAGNFWLWSSSRRAGASTSKGIHAWRFEPSTGHVTSLGLVAETVNPAYVNATPDRRFLYATNWQTADAAAADTVSAYAINNNTGALTLDNGRLKEIQQLSTLPADFKGRNTTAEIQLEKS